MCPAVHPTQPRRHVCRRSRQSDEWATAVRSSQRSCSSRQSRLKRRVRSCSTERTASRSRRTSSQALCKARVAHRAVRVVGPVREMRKPQIFDPASRPVSQSAIDPNPKPGRASRALTLLRIACQVAPRISSPVLHTGEQRPDRLCSSVTLRLRGSGASFTARILETRHPADRWRTPPCTPSPHVYIFSRPLQRPANELQLLQRRSPATNYAQHSSLNGAGVQYS